LNTILGSEIKILFYILLGAIYLFSTFYKREKRKQEERRANKRPVSTQKAEDIFRELQKSLNLPRETAERPMVGKRVPMQKMPMREKVVRTIKPKTAAQIKRMDIVAAEKKADDANPEKTLAERLDFDPRKAVIFAELLKRPQY
jgi:hypothetical protein